MNRRYLIRTLKKGNAKKIVITFFVIFVVIYLLVMLITKTIEPTLLTLCEVKAKAIALQVTNDVIAENLKDIKYDNLLSTKKDNNGKIVAIDADVMEMNRLSTMIAMQVQGRLSKIESSSVNIALGSITGSNILAAMGPSINIKIIPAGTVKTQFKSQFISAGINQTSHKIYMEVTATVRIVAPFVSKAAEFVNDVIVAETILIGDVPSTYYNITGIEGLQQKDALEVIQ